MCADHRCVPVVLVDPRAHELEPRVQRRDDHRQPRHRRRRAPRPRHQQGPGLGSKGHPHRPRQVSLPKPRPASRRRLQHPRWEHVQPVQCLRVLRLGFLIRLLAALTGLAGVPIFTVKVRQPFPRAAGSAGRRGESTTTHDRPPHLCPCRNSSRPRRLPSPSASLSALTSPSCSALTPCFWAPWHGRCPWRTVRGQRALGTGASSPSTSSPCPSPWLRPRAATMVTCTRRASTPRSVY